MEEVKDLLTEANLDQYAAKFEEEGWDDLDTVLSMTEDDIKTCIDKPGHVRKLFLKLQKIIEQRSQTQNENREDVILSGNSAESNIVSSKIPSDSGDLSKTAFSKCRMKPRESFKGANHTDIEQCKSTRRTYNSEPRDVFVSDETASGIIDKHTSDQKATDFLITSPDCALNIGQKKEDINQDKLSAGLSKATYLPDSSNTASCLNDEDQEQAFGFLSESQLQPDTNSQVNEVRAFAIAQKPSTCTLIKTLTYAEHVHQPAETANKGQLKTVLGHHKRKHDDLHVDTRAFEEAKYILEDRYWLTIVGHPGDGKTWMGHQLVFDYIKQGYEPVLITCADDWKKNVGGRGSCKQIAFLDDIFGSINMDERRVSDWLSLLENAEALVKERHGSLMVVCSTRKNIFEEVKPKLSKYKIIERMRLIDMSSSNQLSQDEKKMLLQKYQEHYCLHIDQRIINAQKKTTHGFPHCVEMFCTNENLRKVDLDFFEHPIEFLEKEMDNLYISEIDMFCTLVAVLISLNFKKPIAVCDLSKSVNIFQKAADCCCSSETFSADIFKRCIAQLVYTYIEQDVEEVLYFKHSSYSEVVSLTIAKKNPHLALDILDFEFLMKRVKCCNFRRSIESVVILPCTYLKKLAELLTDAMLCKYSQVFGHQAFTCIAFLEVWFKYVSCTMFDNRISLLERVMPEDYRTYLLKCVPSSSLNYLIPKLTSSNLLKKYWDTETGKQHSTQALIRAADENCSTHLLGCLLDIGANMTYRFYESKDSALLSAVKNGNIENAIYLVSRGACPCILTGSDNIIVLANKSNKPELIKYVKNLVLDHADVLQTIERGREVSLCHLLTKAYYDYFARSVCKEDVCVCRRSLESDVHHEILAKTDLHSAIDRRVLDIETLRQLIETGVNVDLPDEKGRPPFFKALKYSLDSEVLFCLALHTKNKNVKDFKGKNAFHYLALAKHIKRTDFDLLVQLLVMARCNENELDNYGRPPIALASFESIKRFCNNQELQVNFNMCHDFSDEEFGLQIKEAVLSDNLLSLLDKKATYKHNMLMVFKTGWINFGTMLHYLNDKMWKSRFLLYSDLDIKAFTKDGLSLSWLPEKDTDAHKLIRTLRNYGIDIQKTFSQVEQIDSIEMELARRELFIALHFVLQTTPDWHWVENWSYINEMLHIVLDTKKPINDIFLEMLLQEERVKQCLKQMAPYVIRTCIENFPTKLVCARYMFKHLNSMVFTSELKSTLRIAVESLKKHHDEKSYLTSYCNKNNLNYISYDCDLDILFVCLIDILQVNNMLTDTQDENGQTSLMKLLQLNIVSEYKATVQKLVCHTNSFLEKDIQGRNILHYLVTANLNVKFKEEMIEHVKRKGVEPDTQQWTSLASYCLSKTAALKLTCDLQVPVDETSFHDLIDQSISRFFTLNDNVQKNFDILDMTRLINNDCKNVRDLTGVTMLAHACRALNSEQVIRLLSEGADPNERDILNQTSLHKLFCSELLLSSKYMIKQLFSLKYKEINQYSEIKFLHLVDVPFCSQFLRQIEGDSLWDQHDYLLDLVNRALYILFQLLETGANPNQMDIMGRSPLHLCAGAYVPDAFVCPAMKMLIAYGADVNLDDFNGMTPLMTCAQYVHTKHRRMNILIKAGAKVTVKDYSGNCLPQHVMIGAFKRKYVNLRSSLSEDTQS